MSDIQATQQAATGSVITAAIRLRGISIGATGTAGVLTLTNGNGGTTLLSVNVPANDIYTLNIPEDGILFPARYLLFCFYKFNRLYSIHR
jgi:hypothetical protein